MEYIKPVLLILLSEKCYDTYFLKFDFFDGKKLKHKKFSNHNQLFFKYFSSLLQGDFEQRAWSWNYSRIITSESSTNC